MDASGGVPFSETIGFEGSEAEADFHEVKGENFDNAKRGRIYHYCVWANAMPSGISGISDVDFADGDFVGPGDDIIVSLDEFSAEARRTRGMAATFLHELGHNFQQRHGGGTHFRRNPSYSSVLSYSWQLRTSLSDESRVAEPIYAPFYYRLEDAVEEDGAVPEEATNVLPDYSRGMGRRLDESALNEPVGLYDSLAVDWDGDGDANDTSATRDLNGDEDTTDVWEDYPNWFRLVYSGPRRNGRFGE